LFLDALRHRPHPTHTTVERAVKYAEQLQPRRVFFTHMCHDLGHEKTEAALPGHIRLAYDGLEIAVQAECNRVARSLSEAAGFGPSAVAIGVFDGVHTGHQELLKATVKAARELGAKPTVLTFDPHPACVVAPDRAPKLLYPVDERCRLLKQYGIEQILVLPFTKEVAQLPPEDFAEGILAAGLHPRAVIVGETFRFGYRQGGNVNTLREFGAKSGFEIRAIPAVRRRGVVVSSSEIRKMVEIGAVEKSGRLLGRPYSLSGDVVKGHGIGHKQTVPTLNLSTSAELLPMRGVYVTRTSDLDDERKWNSITNIGVRPTFGGDLAMSIETFLLSPFSEPTPSRIKVEFLRRVREERKFETPEALKSQIMRDVGRAQALFRRLAKAGLSL
jgi:riboflavin kinase/FMN adenylyltransferase